MEKKTLITYASILAAVLILSITAYALLHSSTRLTHDTSYVLDISAQQSVLAQRILVHASAATASKTQSRATATADLQKDVARMRNSHELLTGSAAIRPEAFRQSKALNDLFFAPPFQLDQQVRHYLQTADNLAAHLDDPKQAAFYLEEMRLALQERLLEGLRQGSRHFQAEVMERASVLRGLGLAALALVCILLALEAYLVFRPLAAALNSHRLAMSDLGRRVVDAEFTDPLTGLPNRARFNEAASSLILRAQDDGTPLCLLLLDIDHFARVNAEFGGEAGDRLLAELALLIQNNLKVSDQVFRFHGEQFAILAPDTPPDGAQMLAEKLRRLLRATRLQSDLTLTASLGLAALAPGESRDGLVNRAALALQSAKGLGRDRLELAQPPQGS